MGLTGFIFRFLQRPLFEQNGARITDFRRGQSLGTRDHIVRWPNPADRPQWMTPEQYALFPDESRCAKSKSPTRCVITLVDHRRVGKDDLSALYARRWSVGPDLRNLNTTIGMDVLSCQGNPRNLIHFHKPETEQQANEWLLR